MGRKLMLLFGLIALNLDAVLAQTCNDNMLTDATKALKKVIYYLEKHKTELILDNALGFRITLDQLEVAIETSENRVISDHYIDRLKFIKQLAEKIAPEVVVNAEAHNPPYWEAIGHTSEPGAFKLKHSLKTVNRQLINSNPDDCNKMLDVYGKHQVSDKCLAFSNKKYYKDTNEKCRLPDYCMRNITYPNYKYYPLTHQVIDLALAETNDCLKDFDKFFEGGVDKLRDMLCANVLRDAESIEKANFPWFIRDLFMETILTCGFYGYIDFLRENWLYKILKWQHPDGGFRIPPGGYHCEDGLESASNTRVKRNDAFLNDGGSAHATSVAMNALTAIIRLCIDTLPPLH